MRRRFNCDPKWITVRYTAKYAEPNCHTKIDSPERAFCYPSDKALYGTRCGRGEKAEGDFHAHRRTKTAIDHSTKENTRRLNTMSVNKVILIGNLGCDPELLHAALGSEGSQPVDRD